MVRHWGRIGQGHGDIKGFVVLVCMKRRGDGEALGRIIGEEICQVPSIQRRHGGRC